MCCTFAREPPVVLFLGYWGVLEQPKYQTSDVSERSERPLSHPKSYKGGAYYLKWTGGVRNETSTGHSAQAVLSQTTIGI